MLAKHSASLTISGANIRMSAREAVSNRFGRIRSPMWIDLINGSGMSTSLKSLPIMSVTARALAHYQFPAKEKPCPLRSKRSSSSRCCHKDNFPGLPCQLVADMPLLEYSQKKRGYGDEEEQARCFLRWTLMAPLAGIPTRSRTS